jgi:predicted Zn finger-like uncharacterized protein
MSGQSARESPPVITICPQCQLPLAVTAADLRIAQGQVRCGRCAAVFNALASLYEPPVSAAERRAGGGATADAGPESAQLAPGAGPVAGAIELTAVTAAAAEPSPQHSPERQVAAEPAGGPSTDAFHASPVAAPPAPPERNWEIDTMTAAELAALVARSDRDEPAELASIQIAVDDATEITVLPSERPRRLHAATGAVPAELSLPADDSLARSLPRLDALPVDDPGIEHARAAAAAAGRARADATRTDSSLRWLELEPAQPAPGSLAASLGLAAEADFGARTGIGVDAGVDADADAYAEADDERAGIAALAAQLQRGSNHDRRPLDLDRGPRAAREPARGTYAVGLDDIAPQEPTDPALEIAATGARRRGAPASPLMWAATVVLGLALGAQLAHLYRVELLALPALSGPLTNLYAALGRPVAPRWDVGRYEVRQQGVVAEPVAAGTLTVRASIRNGAARAQPAPLLRVILQDRFGNRVATRDLTPREYGGAAAIAPPPMLAPGQRIDAEVSLLDPGGEAVGFELDVCLRRPDATVSCANDAPAVHG